MLPSFSQGEDRIWMDISINFSWWISVSSVLGSGRSVCGSILCNADPLCVYGNGINRRAYRGGRKKLFNEKKSSGSDRDSAGSSRASFFNNLEKSRTRDGE